MKPYKQTTYETCLAVSLLQLIGIPPTHKKEVEIWQNGWKFNFLTGQLNYLVRNYQVHLELIVNNKYFAYELKKQIHENIEVFHKNITPTLITDLLEYAPVIVYLDNHFLSKKTHSAHFVLVLSSTGKCFKIFDPWDGKIKNITKKTLEKGVQSLKKNLKFSPLLVRVKTQEGF